MKKSFFIAGILLCALSSAKVSYSQDLRLLGGALTNTFLPPEVSLQLPAPLIPERSARYNFHIDGHAQFHTTFDLLEPSQKAKVGPLFNHSSCGGCHVQDGKGPIKFGKNGNGSTMLIKVSLKGLNRDGTTKNIPGTPEQIQDHQVTGKSPYNISLKWTESRGKNSDGTIVKLRKPLLSFAIPGVDRKKVVSSLRMSPSIIGMGLLEAVPDSTLIAMSDPYDLDRDGISGEVNYVIDAESNTKKIGRFGFKASHPTVRQQSAAALFHDMGVTSSMFNDTFEDPEITDENLEKMTFYQQLAGVSPAINQDHPDVIAGKQIFQDINCHACHTMTLKTASTHINPEIVNQEFHPFTDLLLHNMGAGLADSRAEFDAAGSEWRTTPLWGLRVHKLLSKAKPGFLHDGRARTVEEAIQWHDGEAKASRKAFRALSAADRAKLLKFLDSI